MVKSCSTVDDLKEKGKHGFVRFALYRKLAEDYGYRGERLPLPWGVEISIKALFPGAGPEEWVRFKYTKCAEIKAELLKLSLGATKKRKTSTQ